MCVPRRRHRLVGLHDLVSIDCACPPTTVGLAPESFPTGRREPARRAVEPRAAERPRARRRLLGVLSPTRAGWARARHQVSGGQPGRASAHPCRPGVLYSDDACPGPPASGGISCRRRPSTTPENHRWRRAGCRRSHRRPKPNSAAATRRRAVVAVMGSARGEHRNSETRGTGQRARWVTRRQPGAQSLRRTPFRAR